MADVKTRSVRVHGVRAVEGGAVCDPRFVLELLRKSADLKEAYRIDFGTRKLALRSQTLPDGLVGYYGALCWDRQDDLPTVAVGDGTTERPVLDDEDDHVRESSHFMIIDIRTFPDMPSTNHRPYDCVMFFEVTKSGPKEEELKKYISIKSAGKYDISADPLTRTGALDQLGSRGTLKLITLRGPFAKNRSGLTSLQLNDHLQNVLEVELTIRPPKGGYMTAVPGLGSMVQRLLGKKDVTRGTITFDQGMALELLDDVISLKVKGVSLLPKESRIDPDSLAKGIIRVTAESDNLTWIANACGCSFRSIEAVARQLAAANRTSGREPQRKGAKGGR